MRRTQLYLDDPLWNALHTEARSRKTTMSELVREAVRERYLGSQSERQKAMLDFIGSRPSRSNVLSAVEYVRTLRRDRRLSRLTNR